MFPTVYEVKNQMGIIRINRPEASNAINSEVMSGLAKALEQAASDEHIHVVILTGAGERSFAAGGDLKEFHDDLQTPEQVYAKWAVMRDVLLQIASFPKPVIGAINGAARGGGAELALACHFRVFSETATIGFVQIKLGISPGWGGAALLARTIGYQKAMRLLLTGKVIPAREAITLGVADVVAAPGQFWQETLRFAQELADQSPAAVQGIMSMMRQGNEMRLEEAMDLECRLCASLWNSESHQTVMADFFNKKRMK